MPKTTLLMVLIQFSDHSITDTVVTLLLKNGLRFFTRTIRNGLLRIFWFGLISYCFPHCKFNCKFRPWMSLAIFLKMCVVDQCAQRHIKQTSADMFECFWQKLTRPWHVTIVICHVTCDIWQVGCGDYYLKMSGLEVMMFWWLGGIGSLNKLLNCLIHDGGVCRTTLSSLSPIFLRPGISPLCTLHTALHCLSVYITVTS